MFNIKSLTYLTSKASNESQNPKIRTKKGIQPHSNESKNKKKTNKTFPLPIPIRKRTKKLKCIQLDVAAAAAVTASIAPALIMMLFCL